MRDMALEPFTTGKSLTGKGGALVLIIKWFLEGF